MRKNIKYSLLIVLILIILCGIVVVLNPLKDAVKNDSNSFSDLSNISLTSSSFADIESSTLTETSYLIESSVSIETIESSILVESSLSEYSDLIPEDQPDEPNLNFEISGSSFDDIMVNVLTSLLSKDTVTLSTYVGSTGFRLAPTGCFAPNDVVLSADELSSFFSLAAQSYGTYPGSGETIYLTPDEYYDHYLIPTGFDFSAATVSYNDVADINAVSGYVDDPKTVSYRFSPDIMEWKRLIIVYTTEDSGDVLCGMIYQDVTTN